MSEFYSHVRGPVWANAEHTRIDCEVNFNHLDDEFVPFTADPADVMEYSKTIFDECVAGQYGPISEWTPPTDEQVANQVRMQRDFLLSQMDKIVSNPLRWSSMSASEQEAWAIYRQALLDVPEQSGFPHYVNWPVSPDQGGV